jgi:hypothetical protein
MLRGGRGWSLVCGYGVVPSSWLSGPSVVPCFWLLTPTSRGDLCNIWTRCRCEVRESVSIPYFAGRPLQLPRRGSFGACCGRFQSPTSRGDLCNSAPTAESLFRSGRFQSPTSRGDLCNFRNEPSHFQLQAPFQSPTSRGDLCNWFAIPDQGVAFGFQSPTSRGDLCNLGHGAPQGDTRDQFQSPTSRGDLCNDILNSGTPPWQAPLRPLSSFRRRPRIGRGVVNPPWFGAVSRLTTPSVVLRSWHLITSMQPKSSSSHIKVMDIAS